MVVTGLDLNGSLSYEGKADFPPLCVSPVCPDNEGNSGKTAGDCSLDGEEKMWGIVCFEIIDG